MVGAQRQRHRIEEVFEAGNGEAGLDHYEVRSWVGWHHHMTLCPGGVVVPVPGTTASRGGKPRRSRCRRCGRSSRGCSAIRRRRPEEIAAEVTRVLRRNEESRIYHWHKATGEFPPPRTRPESGSSQHPP